MCGIAGVALGAPADSGILRDRVARLSEALEHRGPDDAGGYVSGDRRVLLVNRRLAIRDLSQAGHQPMANSDSSVWITYNGELYNMPTLRSELEARGYVFRSQSDTEVILHGYEEWGEQVVQRLRGMFAFAIYVLPNGKCDRAKLFLARDGLGMKPLYYTCQNGSFAFASECKALRAAGLAGSEINSTALVTYLHLGSVPAPLTIFRDIQAIGAGQTLTVWFDQDTVRVESPRSYWMLPSGRSQVSYQQAVHELSDVLMDSVRRHLVSDVPVGVFLSGGVDSSAIVALIRRVDPASTIRTCSVTFAEADFDESPFIQEAVRSFGTEHVNVHVDASDVRDAMESIVVALDQPSNDGINTYVVSRAARESGLTVALSGVGADELFGGYPTFRRLVKLMPLLRLAGAVPALAGLLEGALRGQDGMRPMMRLAGWLRHAPNDTGAYYLGLRGLYSHGGVAHLVRPSVLADADHFDLPESLGQAANLANASGAWDATSRLELAAYLRHQLLRDTDAMSMAHSLEVRAPFVDVELVDYVLHLPEAVREKPQKQLLRDAVPDLPDVIRRRRAKQGFTFPFARWMAGPLRPVVVDLVSSAASQFREYLDPVGCAHVIKEFDAGRLHWSRVWALAALNTAGHSVSSTRSSSGSADLHIASDRVGAYGD